MREGKLAYRKDDEISSGIYKMIELPNDRVRLEIQLSEEGIEFAEEGIHKCGTVDDG